MSRSLAVPLRASVLPQRVGAMEVLLAFCVMLVLAWALQHRIGAYGAEFSDDDGSHFVTGLLVRDYLARMQPSSPLAFLKEFAAHYPLIGIGHWPPLFYGLEAVWMLLAGTSRSAMLLLSAFITAASATTLYHAAASRLGRAETPWLGRAAGAAVACVFMLCPVVQAQTGMLMLDVLTALLCLLAMLAFAQFMDTARMRDAVLFGLVAGAALMTKGNAACLALLPPLAILIGRRFDLLLRPTLWLSAVVVLAVAGPWYWFTYSLVAVGFQYGFDQNYFVAAGIANLGFLLDMLGPLGALLAAGGMIATIMQPRRGPDAAWLACCVALILAVPVFQELVPSGIQDRYMLPAFLPALLLAAWFLLHLARRLRPTGGIAPALAGLCLFVLSVLPGAAAVTPRPRLGMGEAASQIWRHWSAANPSVLLAMPVEAEGAAISELAMRDRMRPSLFAVRGVRLLGAGGYNTHEYVPRFASPTEVMAAIDEYAIPLVLLQPGQPGRELAHIGQIRDTIAAFPDRWTLLWRSDEGPPAFLYEVVGNAAKPADQAKLTRLSAPRQLVE